MIDKKLLENFDKHDKEQYLKGLKEIIDHSYKLEDEFKELQNITANVIDFLPNALWVFHDNGEIFIQNSEAKKAGALITLIDSNLLTSEIEFENKIYLIKSIQASKKLIISATDITQQKRSQRLASMGKIAAHLAHEIRNPIGAISLLTSTLKNRVKPINRSIVLEIQKSIYRVERIIKSTLLFTKGTSISKESFKLLKLQDEIEDAFENYAMSKDIELSVDFKDCKIDGDFDLLSIVMQNFLYNAIDAIEEDEFEDGKITFKHYNEDKNNIITVTDSGKAIEDETVLFEPFETTKLKGTGLGLNLSLEIIKAHNGKIQLLKEQKGFKIWL